MVRCSPLGFVLLITFLAIGTASAIAQDRSRYPDWSGQWTRGPGMGNGWDPIKPQGMGQQAPLTPEYRARLEAPLPIAVSDRPGMVHPGLVSQPGHVLHVQNRESRA